MMKVIKTGLIYLAAVTVSVLIVMFVNLAHRYQLEPKEVYKVYLDGKVVGNVKDKEELDITSFLKLDQFLSKNKIDAIINCAAYTFVDKAEVDKDTAYYVNVIGPQNLAVLSKKYNIKLID